MTPRAHPRPLFAALALLTLSAMAGGAAAQTPGVDPAALKFSAAVQKHFGELVQRERAPGVVIGILQGSTREVHGLGHLTIAGSGTPDGRTIFEIGPLTKVFTALLLAEAEARGEASAEDTLSTLLPEGLGVPMWSRSQETTLGHMASHFGGFPRIPRRLPVGRDDANPYGHYDLDAMWFDVNDLVLHSSPGLHFTYSEFSFALLGQLLARRAGTSYEGLLNDRITGPLGMADTTTAVDPADFPRVAPSHRPGGDPGIPWTYQSMAPAGALRSTADDLLTFAAAQLEPRGTPLERAIPMTHRVRGLRPGSVRSVALGWFVLGDGETLTEGGVTGGHAAAVYITPSAKQAVVVLANASEPLAVEAGERLFAELLGIPVDPVELPAAARLNLSLDQMRALLGTYAGSPTLGDIVILQRNNDLFARFANGHEAPLTPTSPTTCSLPGNLTQLSFDFSGTDRAQVLRLKEGDFEAIFRLAP